MAAGYVYLIQPTGHNVYKIGCSVNVPRRVATIQCKLDIPLVILHTIHSNDYEWAGTRLHSIYSRYRLDGDWYALPDCAVETIKCIKEM